MKKQKKTTAHYFKNKYSRLDYFSMHHNFERSSPAFLDELEEQWDNLNEEKAIGFRQQTVWNRILEHPGRQKPQRAKTISLLSQLQKIAAILFVPLFISSLVYFFIVSSSNEKAWAEIICPPGTRTQFELPDGSTGTLNGESTLRYATDFTQNREVKLHGEAYFEVVKNNAYPFTVSTSRLKVEVLGTHFSVRAYGDQSNEEVILKSGSVKVLTSNDKALALLSPNQQLLFNKNTNQYIKNEVNAKALTSWIEGKLIIENERFVEVAKRLSRWYDVQIEIQDQQLKNYTYYGTFENEPLDEVLRLISLTAPIKYKEINRVQQGDGSFSDRRIILQTDEKRMNDFN